jgi:transcriptional regulator with XRE-family HTH domain
LNRTRHIGARVFELREQRGWSQAKLAEEAGVSQTTVVHLETEQIAKPRMATLRRIARGFGMSVEELLAPEGGVTSAHSMQIPSVRQSMAHDTVEPSLARIAEEIKLIRKLREICQGELGKRVDAAEFKKWLNERIAEEERLHASGEAS